MKNIFIDIGTHTGQELSLIVYPGIRLFSRNVAKMFLYNGLAGFRILWLMLRIRPSVVIAIDPLEGIDTPWYVKKVRHIKGVVTDQDCETVPLHLHHSSLGHSVYANKRGVNKATSVKNIHIDRVIRTIEDVADAESRIILRINAEGVEGIVISKFLERFHPTLILGTISDVGKVHGESAESRLAAKIEQAGCRLVSFAPNPKTWPNALEAISMAWNRRDIR